MIVEVVIGVLVSVLLVVTTIAALVGLAGMFGVLRIVRCKQCGRLDMTSASDPTRSCLYCRHERLLHPVSVLHHVPDAHHPGRGHTG